VFWIITSNLKAHASQINFLTVPNRKNQLFLEVRFQGEAGRAVWLTYSFQALKTRRVSSKITLKVEKWNLNLAKAYQAHSNVKI